MKVKYLGESDPLSLLNGKVYDVETIDEDGLYEIKDESGEIYCYFPEAFEVVEKKVTEADTLRGLRVEKAESPFCTLHLRKAPLPLSMELQCRIHRA